MCKEGARDVYDSFFHASPPRVPVRTKQKPLRDLRNLTVLGAAAVNAQVQTMRYLVNTKVSKTATPLFMSCGW